MPNTSRISVADGRTPGVAYLFMMKNIPKRPFAAANKAMNRLGNFDFNDLSAELSNQIFRLIPTIKKNSCGSVDEANISSAYQKIFIIISYPTLS